MDQSKIDNPERFRVQGHGSPPITGWSPTPALAGQRASHYLEAGWTSVTITDTAPDTEEQ